MPNKVGPQTSAPVPPRPELSVFQALAQAAAKATPAEVERLCKASEKLLPASAKPLGEALKSLTPFQLADLRKAAASFGCVNLVAQVDQRLPKPKTAAPKAAWGPGRASRAAEPLSRAELAAVNVDVAQRWLQHGLPPQGVEHGLCLSTLEKAMTPRELCAAAYGLPAEKVSEAQRNALARQNPALAAALAGDGPIPAGTTVSLAVTPRAEA